MSVFIVVYVECDSNGKARDARVRGVFRNRVDAEDRRWEVFEELAERGEVFYGLRVSEMRITE